MIKKPTLINFFIPIFVMILAGLPLPVFLSGEIPSSLRFKMTNKTD
jgi:hypothetical protein